MQVWNVLHVARWKWRTQKIAKKSPSAHHRTTLSGYIFTTKAHIDNQKKLIKQQYLLHISSQHGELRFISLGQSCKFQLDSHLGSVTAQHSSIGHRPNFAALNRERHLSSAGRPSRWALAHISSYFCCATYTVAVHQRKTEERLGCIYIESTSDFEVD